MRKELSEKLAREILDADTAAHGGKSIGERFVAACKAKEQEGYSEGIFGWTTLNGKLLSEKQAKSYNTAKEMVDEYMTAQLAEEHPKPLFSDDSAE